MATITIPENQKLFSVVGQNEEGDFWPKTPLIIASSLEEAKEKWIEEKFKELSDEEIEENWGGEEEWREAELSEYGHLWAIREVCFPE